MLLSEPTFVEFLKNDVIPSWENVRDPIKVNLDMGDGRAIHRTIGGNTVLYLIAPNGYVVDAFPGVYLPKDILPELAKSLRIAKRPAEDWLTYHKPGGEFRLFRIGLNAGKSVVEAPVLKELALKSVVGATGIAVIDESHIPRTREQVRRVAGASEVDSDQDAADRAVAIDSRTNISSLRPLVRRLLSDELHTVADLKTPIFKDLLKVPIDDPNLGLTDVVTPGGG